MTVAPRALVLATLLSMAGCGITDPESWDARRLDLEDARAKWSETDPGSYEYAFFRGCFCAGPIGRFDVTVTGGVVTGAVSEDDGEPVPEPVLQELPAVEDLFDIIDNAIRTEVDGFHVRYDADYGYPVLIELDRDRGAVDDELRIEAGSLMPRLVAVR